MGQAETQSKIGEATNLESIHTDLTTIHTDLADLETKLDSMKKALSSIGTDSWRVQTV